MKYFGLIVVFISLFTYGTVYAAPNVAKNKQIIASKKVKPEQYIFKTDPLLGCHYSKYWVDNLAKSKHFVCNLEIDPYFKKYISLGVGLFKNRDKNWSGTVATFNGADYVFAQSLSNIIQYQNDLESPLFNNSLKNVYNDVDNYDYIIEARFKKTSRTYILTNQYPTNIFNAQLSHMSSKKIDPATLIINKTDLNSGNLYAVTDFIINKNYIDIFEPLLADRIGSKTINISDYRYSSMDSVVRLIVDIRPTSSNNQYIDEIANKLNTYVDNNIDSINNPAFMDKINSGFSLEKSSEISFITSDAITLYTYRDGVVTDKKIQSSTSP